MKNKTIKQDKGVAGLTILLSLVVMLFIIGLLVMIFTLMGGELSTATYDTTSISLTNQTTTSVVNASGTTAGIYKLPAYRGCKLTISSAKYTNATATYTIGSGNYTVSGCVVNGSTSDAYGLNKLWNITGTVTYEANNTATKVITDTGTSIATVTDWFDIFIVIGAMVVLILLTVIIITAIRGSGMVEGGQSGASQVGTA